MSGSLLSGGREQHWIVLIAPFEVIARYKRPSYSHFPAVNHKDEGKPEKGRIRKGSCPQDNGSNTGSIPKPRHGIRLHSKDPEVNAQGGSGGPRPEK